MRRIGMEPPTSLDQAWTLGAVHARRPRDEGATGRTLSLRDELSGPRTPIAGCFLVHQHGGRFFRRRPAYAGDRIAERASRPSPGRKSWFRDQLVPPNTSLKSTEPIQNLFANGTIGMMLHGDWQIPFLQQQMTRFQWGVTPMIRDVATCSDLGGNCLAVLARQPQQGGRRPNSSSSSSTRRNSRDFIKAAMLLPVCGVR
jgi:hypothetical protein